MTSQAMCSAACPARPAAADPSSTDFLHIGHFVISSGHSCGAIDRGASQNLKFYVVLLIIMCILNGIYHCNMCTFNCINSVGSG